MSFCKLLLNTARELGNARLYDLCVNTSDYGLERTVELILEAINTRTEQSPAAETAPCLLYTSVPGEQAGSAILPFDGFKNQTAHKLWK